MLEFLSKYLYLVLIIIAFFMMLYFLGGEDIIFFRKKKYNYDIKGEEKLIKALNRFAKIRSFTVLGKTTIAYGEKEYTFDGILLCYFGGSAMQTGLQYRLDATIGRQSGIYLAIRYKPRYIKSFHQGIGCSCSLQIIG